MHRADGFILFQASIPLGSPPGSLFPDMAHKVFYGTPAETDTKQTNADMLTEAIVKAWAHRFAADCTPEEMSFNSQLHIRTDHLTQYRYQNSKWTEGTLKEFDAVDLN